MWICQLIWHFPILLDAATAAVARKGDKFLARWADIMTGITHVRRWRLFDSYNKTSNTWSKQSVAVSELHLTATGNHMPCGITQCYLSPGSCDFPAFTPAEAGTRFRDPIMIIGFKLTPSPLLDNIRIMVIVWRLRGNIIRTALC